MNSVCSSSPLVSANSFSVGFKPSSLDQISSVMEDNAQKAFQCITSRLNLLAMCHLRDWERSRCRSREDRILIYREKQSRRCSCIGVGIVEEAISAFFYFGGIFKTRNAPP